MSPRHPAICTLLLIASAARAETAVDARPALFPTLRVASASASEGNAGLTPFLFRVTLDPASTQTVGVDATVYPGTTEPGEVQFQRTRLTFSPGETQKEYLVQVVGDTDSELNESFSVALESSMNAMVEGGGGDGTIVNDDGSVPTLSPPAAVTVDEGNGGVREVMLTIELAPATNEDVLVEWWAQLESSADDRSDFMTITPSPVVFKPGETEKTVVLGIVGDTVGEADERIIVEIGQEAGAFLAAAKTIVTVRNDDPIPDGGLPRGDAGPDDAGPTPDGSAGLPADGAAALAPPAITSPDESGGCNCRVGGGTSGPPFIALLGALALGWLRRRRR